MRVHAAGTRRLNATSRQACFTSTARSRLTSSTWQTSEWRAVPRCASMSPTYHQPLPSPVLPRPPTPARRLHDPARYRPGWRSEERRSKCPQSTWPAGSASGVRSISLASSQWPLGVETRSSGAHDETSSLSSRSIDLRGLSARRCSTGICCGLFGTMDYS